MFKNLFQQFQRAANVYFLVIGCLQLDVFFPGLSPTHWSTTIGPLLVVLSINAAKEAVDDYGRHKSDAEVNARTVEVVRVTPGSSRGDEPTASRRVPDEKDQKNAIAASPESAIQSIEHLNVRFERVKWRDLRVGDVARVRGDAEIPADMLLVASSDPASLAYVETANLDGETNLKVKCVAPIFAADPLDGATTFATDPLDAAKLVRALGGARLECEAPNNQLYKFEGKWIAGGREQSRTASRAEVSSREVGLSADNVLLRGSTLRNAKWALGVVIFTGGDTKLMRNATRAPRKTSRLERHMNVLVMCVGAFQTLVGLALAGAQREWLWRENPEAAAGGSGTNAGANMRHWYLEPSGVWPDVEVADANGFFTQFVRFVVLLNALIPISLYVTLELVKVIQCFLIARDRELYDAENDRRCGVRTTTLNEELGAVSCVLSDKTGTLTRNVMAFVKCSVAGVVYGDENTENTKAHGELGELGDDDDAEPRAFHAKQTQNKDGENGHGSRRGFRTVKRLGAAYLDRPVGVRDDPSAENRRAGHERAQAHVGDRTRSLETPRVAALSAPEGRGQRRVGAVRGPRGRGVGENAPRHTNAPRRVRARRAAHARPRRTRVERGGNGGLDASVRRRVRVAREPGRAARGVRRGDRARVPAAGRHRRGG